jgi:UDP-N-acetyl-D-mannosaminuronic acid dehydrogenase
MDIKRVCVVGLGYIGLPTAAVIAARGVKVFGLDVNKEVIDTINRGSVHIVEPELEMLVNAAVKSGHLEANLEPQPADAFMIAVPTPFKTNHEPDLSYIESAARAIAPVLESGNLVVLESTSPVGATEAMMAILSEERPDLTFPNHSAVTPNIHVAHCPERVLPGRVIHELVENDRIIGGMTPACAQRAKSLYKIFVRGDCLITDCRTAEMTKLTENAFRDVNIAFANELSLICNKHDIDVWELIRLANRHPRVNILKPGPGVGGHCIAVDPWFIVDSAPELAKLIQTAREVNDSKPKWVVDQVRALAESRPNASILCLGLAFKANIDDLRESPALRIFEALAAEFPGRVTACEPYISKFDGISVDAPILHDANEAIASADIVVVLVDHDQFKNFPVETFEGKEVIDTRGVQERSCRFGDFVV